MKNGQYSAADVRAICETKLRIQFRDRGECNGWYLFGGRKVARITVPNGAKFVPPGTYGSMARQLKLTIKEFDSLLDCPLSKAAYDALLKSRVAS